MKKIFIGMMMLLPVAAVVAMQAMPTAAAEKAAKVKKTFAVTEFRSIDAECAAEVQFSIGSAYSVVAEGEAKDIDAYEVKCKDGELKISAKDDRRTSVTIKLGKIVKDGRSSGSVVFRVTAPVAPSEVELSGASSFQTKSPLEAKQISFDVSGASHVICGAVKAEEIFVECSGASSLSSGWMEAKKACFDMSGTSVCQASVKADAVNVDCSGASHCTVEVSCERLTADASGASSITLSGTAKQVSTDTSGISTIKKKGLKLSK